MFPPQRRCHEATVTTTLEPLTAHCHSGGLGGRKPPVPSGNTAALLLIDCCMILAYWLYRLVSDATGGMEVAAPPGMEAIGIGMEAIGACMDDAGGTVETAGWEAAPWKGPNPVRTPMFAAAKAAAGGGP